VAAARCMHTTSHICTPTVWVPAAQGLSGRALRRVSCACRVVWWRLGRVLKVSQAPISVECLFIATLLLGEKQAVGGRQGTD
jgi:hypothetical protein